MMHHFKSFTGRLFSETALSLRVSHTHTRKISHRSASSKIRSKTYLVKSFCHELSAFILFYMKYMINLRKTLLSFFFQKLTTNCCFKKLPPVLNIYNICFFVCVNFLSFSIKSLYRVNVT